jgi:putative transport protein
MVELDWLNLSITESSPTSVAMQLLVLAIVVASGLMLGQIRFFGVRLGAAGVLFSGMIFGHIGWSLPTDLLEFTGDFGLILFVFAIGLTIGPGFFNALRAQGLTLNLLAATVVLLGVLLTVAVNRIAGIEMPIAVGIFSGATTNTPSLAAAVQTLRDHPPSAEVTRRSLAQTGVSVSEEDAAQVTPNEIAKLPGLGYAVSYPLGVVGIITSMLVMRILFRVDPVKEAAAIQESLQSQRPMLERRNLRVTNPNLEGLMLCHLPGLSGPSGSCVVISRMLHDEELSVPHASTQIHVGDVLLAVGTVDQLDQLRIVVGEWSSIDLMEIHGEITFRWIVVTHPHMVGQALDELQLNDHFDVQVTRVRRSEIEMPPVPQMRLAMGDQLLVVGRSDMVASVARKMGDIPKELERSDLAPLFAGIAFGVLVGSIPIVLPGTTAPVKLGLAGGPLLVAIVLGSIGRLGPWIFYLPRPASHLMREIGIAIFLATVGLRGGDRFVVSLVQGDGVWWLLAGVAITVVPLLIVAAIGRYCLRLDYPTLVGVIAGSMTDPPALSFANEQTDSELPSISYASVVPLTMILRVLAAQGLVLTGG